MFVQACVALPLDATRARAALERALLDGGLTAESRRAYDEGLTFLMRVGPHGGHGIAKQVHVHTLPPRAYGDTVTVPLRWEATGPARRLFPVLDANLDLTRTADGTALLSVVGRYAPPLGRLGAPLDETLLSGVAQHTVDALLDDIATKLTRLAAGTPPPDRERQPDARPVGEPGRRTLLADRDEGTASGRG